MRKEIILNNGWIFHKGDIEEPISKYKGFIYCQSKTERKLRRIITLIDRINFTVI